MTQVTWPCVFFKETVDIANYGLFNAKYTETHSDFQSAISYINWLKVHLRRPFLFTAMWLHILVSFLCSKKLSNLAQT